MKTSIRGHIILLLSVIILITAGCKGGKKAREAAAAKARMEQEAADKKKREDLAMKEAEEKAMKTEQANREMEERLRKAEEEKANTPTSQKLEQYFSSISSAPSVTAANSSIQEALTLFSSDQAPVLIVISEEGGKKDYDKPTTIKNYLNYLKDQKKNINRVGNVELDTSGKIKELELKK